MLYITESQYREQERNGYAMTTEDGSRAAFLPGHGTTLYFEHKHFEIIPDNDTQHKTEKSL